MKVTKDFRHLRVSSLSIIDGFTFPVTDGIFGQFLMTNGAGTATWESPGAIGITTDDVSEGSNLYYTNERVDDRVSLLIQNGTGISWTYNDSLNKLTPNVSLNPFSTTNLSEGINLYFTNERVDDRVSALIKNGTGLNWTYNDSLGTLTGIVNIGAFTTDDLPEGSSNLYFSNEAIDDRVAAFIKPGTGISWVYNDLANTLTPTISLSPFNTGNLLEGSNLYYTNERVDDRVAALINDSATITWTYNDSLGTLTANAIQQNIEIEQEGVLKSTRSTLNFKAGSNIILSIIDNGISEAADITISASFPTVYGSVHTIKWDGSQIGESDINVLDFSDKFSLTEYIDKNISIDVDMGIGELNDASVMSPISNLDVLAYNAGTGNWENVQFKHNNLDELQGGLNDEMYHLSAIEYIDVQSLDYDTLSLITSYGSPDTLSYNGQDIAYFDDIPFINLETFNNEIVVSVNGSDLTGDGTYYNPYRTIKYAVDSITDAGSNNQYIIQVLPGIYTEDQIILNDYVSIYGRSETGVIIQPNDVNNPLFKLGHFTLLHRFTVRNCTNSSAIDFTKASSNTKCTKLVFLNCLKSVTMNASGSRLSLLEMAFFSQDSNAITIDLADGYINLSAPVFSTITMADVCIKIDGADSSMIINNLSLLSGNINKVVEVSNGANVEIISSTMQGFSGNHLGTGIHITDTNSQCKINSCNIKHADIAILLENSGETDVIGCILYDNDIGIEVDNSGTGSLLRLNSTLIYNSTTFDLNITSDIAEVIGSGNILSEDYLFIETGAKVNLTYFSNNEADEGLNIRGELHVGSPEFPKESTLGEGDSYTRGMIAYTYNGSTYTEITNDVKSASGSSFTFPNNSVNTAIYLSSDLVVSSTGDYHQFFGIKMNLLTPQSGGTVAAEYWNGSTWVEFNHMTSLSGEAYYRKSNTLFENTANSYQVRFNPFMISDWAKNNDPSHDANDRYWIRFRITSSPATLPVFEQFKLHSNRTEINDDGFMEYFGKGRPYVSIPTSWGTFRDVGTTLADQDLWLTTHNNVGLENNVFNTDGDSVGTVTSLPSWADTSAPMRVRVAVMSAASGSLTMIAWLNSSSEGDTIYTADPVSTTGETSVSVTKTVTAGQLEWFEFELDVSGKGIQAADQFPESLWINIEADTRPGNVNGLQFELAMLKWKDGDHILA